MTMQKISELADGELDGPEAQAAYAALKSGGEALEAWRRYHLISDAVRDTPLLSAGFSDRVAARLALEPTVLAPRALPASRRSLPWYAARVAAGLSAVAFVSYATLNMLDPAGSPQVAQVPQALKPAAADTQEPAQATSPVAIEVARDYMHAHQGYSPRNALQGHVQPVSGPTRRQ